MKKGVKILFILVLIALVGALINVDFNSVTRPIEFEQKAHARDLVVIDRLIDIKDAQVAYRKEKGTYAANFDDLINFLKNENDTTIVKDFELNDLQIDLIAGYMKSDLKIKNSDLFEVTPDKAHAYVDVILKDAKVTGKQDRINEINRLNIIPASRKKDKEWIKSQMVEQKYRRDTIVTSYLVDLYDDATYEVDSLRYVPFGNGAEFDMVINDNGDLFEARADFEVYMKGIDDQELANYLLKIKKSNQQLRRIPEVDEDGKQIFYADGSKKETLIPCRIIGNAETPNNNAGNWPERD